MRKSLIFWRNTAVYRDQKHEGKLLNNVQLGSFAQFPTQHHVLFLEYI